MMLGGSHKLTNILLHQKNPLCKLRLGAHNHEWDFNKPLNFIQALIPLKENFTQEASTSKNIHPINGKQPQQVTMKRKKPLNALRKEKKIRHVPREGKKPQHVTTSHAPRKPTCHFCDKDGYIQWRRKWKSLI